MSCRETREGLEGACVDLSSNAPFAKGLELTTQFNMQIKLLSTLHLLLLFILGSSLQ